MQKNIREMMREHIDARTYHTTYPDDVDSLFADGRDRANNHDQLGDTPIAITVPTLVLMLDGMSNYHHDNYNDIYLHHEVHVQITPQIYRMCPGEHTDFVGLFDPFLLDITPSWTHKYVLSCIVSELVAQGKVPLEVVGYNSKLNEIYRKI